MYKAPWSWWRELGKQLILDPELISSGDFCMTGVPQHQHQWRRWSALPGGIWHLYWYDVRGP